MNAISKIIRGTGVSKAVGSSTAREFLVPGGSNRNIWFNRRRYEH